jgi:hypothetical protein
MQDIDDSPVGSSGFALPNAQAERNAQEQLHAQLEIQAAALALYKEVTDEAGAAACACHQHWQLGPTLLTRSRPRSTPLPRAPARPRLVLVPQVMAEMPMPTNDDHVSTFHAYCKEDALQNFHEHIGALALPPAAVGALELELNNQIAEWMDSRLDCSALKPHLLFEQRQLEGGVFHGIWKDNIEQSVAAYDALLAELVSAVQAKQQQRTYKGVGEFDRDIAALLQRFDDDERWSATAKRLSREKFEQARERDASEARSSIAR